MVVCCILAAVSRASAAGPTVATIREAALARQDAIKDVWVEYDVDYEFFTDSPSVRSRYIREPYSMTFALMGERRLALERPKKGEKALDRTYIFDGEYTILKEAASLAISPGKDRMCENSEQYCLHALQMPYKDEDRVSLGTAWFFPECLRQERLFGKSVYRLREAPEVIDGHECQVLEYPERDTVWVDLSIGGAIRRRERFNPDAEGRVRRFQQFDFSDYRQTSSGIWAPWHCEMTLYGMGVDPPELKDQPIVKEILDVREIRINELSANDFAVKLIPGMRVFTTEGGFLVPGDDEELLTDFGAVLGRQGHRPQRYWSWLVMINVAVMAGLAVGIALQAWRRRYRPGVRNAAP